jgi:uncharacterized repeat protein (TIGR01451 family)
MKFRKTLARCLFLSSIVLILLSFTFAHAIADTISPTAPSDFTASAYPGSKVLLAWKTSTDNEGVAGYNVYRRSSSGGQFVKLNATLIKALFFDDATATVGKNYDYKVRAVDNAGNVSGNSTFASAPNLVMNETAVIRHMGEVVDTAVPGDSIEYIIDYTNNGYGFAKDVAISHSIPKGTELLPRSVRVKKGLPIEVLYFDLSKGRWVEKYSSEANVTKVKFIIKDSVPAVSKGPNGILSLKVLVGF